MITRAFPAIVLVLSLALYVQQEDLARMEFAIAILGSMKIIKFAYVKYIYMEKLATKMNKSVWLANA